MAKHAEKPDCNAEQVLTFISCARTPASLNSLQRYFGFSAHEMETVLQPVLDDLQNNGKITATKPSGKSKNWKFSPSEKERISELMVIKISRISDEGDVFVTPVKSRKTTLPTLKLGTRDKKKYADPELIGRKLLIRLKDRSGYDATGGRISVQCQVEQELQHGEPGLLTGKVKVAADGKPCFVPDLKGIKEGFDVHVNPLQDLEDGDHVMASVCEQFDQAAKPKVNMVERVWRPGQQSSKIALHILTQNGKRLRTPPKIDKAANRYAKGVSFKTYKDLRDIGFITIDGRDVNERDDAIAAVDENGQRILYTAIADASAYVPVGSEWDEWAMENPFSIYAYGRNVDMLPKSIVHGHASLDQGTDRPAIVLKRILDHEGHIADYEFIPAIINVKANLSYDRVDQALDPINPRPLASDLQKVVETHHRLIGMRRQYYLDQQIFEMPETKIYPLFDTHGMVCELVSERNSISRQDIKYAMIDNGILAGEVLSQTDIDFIGRIHDDPEEDMIANVAAKLLPYGIDMPIGDAWAPADYTSVMEHVTKPHIPQFIRDSVKHIILSGLMRAAYEWNGEGHFGVATPDAYIKATSPLRDAAQLINQRALKKAIGCYDGPICAFEDDPHKTAEFMQHLVVEEDSAKKTQKEALQAYAIETLCHLKGQIVAAQLVGYNPETGLSVRVDNCPVVFDVPLDGFELAKDRKSCFNRLSGQRYKFGEFIDVRIQKVDPQKRNIDIKLLIDHKAVTKKLQPGSPKYRAQKSDGGRSLKMPRAVPCHARVIEANTKNGITLELDLPDGPQIYRWPRDGYSLGARNGGVFLYPKKKKSKGMAFIEGEDVILLVRCAKKSGKVMSVEVPQSDKVRVKKPEEQGEQRSISSFEELAAILPAQE